MTARERHRAAVVERDPFVCSLTDDKCRGILEADHILKTRAIERRHEELVRRLALGQLLEPVQRQLVGASYDVLLADARNGWLLCELHHGIKDRRLMKVPAEALPEHFWQFVDEYGLDDLATREGLLR